MRRLKENKNLINEKDFLDFIFEAIKVKFWDGEEKEGFLVETTTDLPYSDIIARYMLIPFRWDKNKMQTVFAWKMVKEITHLNSNKVYLREQGVPNE
ncbi:hypothetical protein [Mycoplasmopsis gallinacea]|uniref:Uncharacterized protein n=1 Tax=Mycoplasmopsis gallinacea TaxID=29556 RepID=A0A449A2I1_9BACT|nr:hypothetical protein [Mycoplasmopsis gallinacea]VEU58412.1 Uncharacterised protein [Mycoplasmopsis gallinacea]